MYVSYSAKMKFSVYGTPPPRPRCVLIFSLKWSFQWISQRIRSDLQPPRKILFSFHRAHWYEIWIFSLEPHPLAIFPFEIFSLEIFPFEKFSLKIFPLETLPLEIFLLDIFLLEIFLHEILLKYFHLESGEHQTRLEQPLLWCWQPYNSRITSAAAA